MAGTTRLWLALALAIGAEALAFLGGETTAVTLVEMALAATAIWLAGIDTCREGFAALRRGRLNIAALMSVAVTGAFLIGQWPEAAMVMALYAIAELIEARSVGRARNAIQGLLALARIIHAVEEAQGSRAPMQRFVDRFAAVYTPAVFAFALGVAVVGPFALGWGWSDAVYKALVLLVIACPCALVISTPVTVVSALATAARRGILIKGGAHLEAACKLKAIEGLQRTHGPIGMTGDGINDAPALARADIGFAMGRAGTDTAMEAADVVIMSDDLRRIPETIHLSRRTRSVLWQNIALALGIKAAFLLLAVFGAATMWMAVFADMGASLLVVGNGLRLLRAAK